MVDVISLGWLVFVGLFLVSLVASWLFVHYFADKYEHERFPNIVVVISLTMIVVAELLIPIDIYVVSSGHDVETRQHALRIIYAVVYVVVLVLCFLVLPFTYFYYEERDSEVTTKQRVFAGLKYTIFLLVMLVVLAVVGVFVKGASVTGDPDISDYVKKLFADEAAVERALAFALGCLACVGFLCFLTYTAFGFSVLPVGMMRGRRDPLAERREVEGELTRTREARRALASRYAGGGRRAPEDEQARIGLLDQRERGLARRERLLAERASACWRACYAAARPFALVIGIALQLFALFVVVSFLLSLIDRIAHSYCGSGCGFLLKYPKIFNPLDQLLVLLSRVFPLDYVLFSAVLVFVLATTLAGVTRLGVRFLWVLLFRFRRARTPPQGLVFAALILVLALLAFNFELMTLSPQYLQFGSQEYAEANGTVVRCSLAVVSGAGNCTMTQVGLFMSRLSLRLGFFGEIFYWAGWAFIAAWLIGLLYAVFRRASSAADEDDDDDDLLGD
jgi:LMBR1 domain-containing protein 1